MTVEKIRVLLADDHAIFREGLRALLERSTDIQIVGESSTGSETVQLTKKLTPDIVVMDIGMRDLNGVQAASLIHTWNESVKILILSMLSDEESIEQSIKAGASGYLVKDAIAVELITAIRELKRGNAFFSPSVSKILLDQKRNSNGGKKPDSLTFREKEILQYIADGKTTREIADALSISSKTVDNHRQAMMAKLDIHDQVTLTRYALSKGIVK
jgi:DNA-binding NarL/FixJ family response regulator